MHAEQRQLTQSLLSWVMGPRVPCMERFNGGSRLGAVMRPNVQASACGPEDAEKAATAAGLAASRTGSS